MTCKGICIRYRATKPAKGGRYSNGQRRCQMCEEFLNWEGLWCPCCGYRLRSHPRNKVYKEKLRNGFLKFGDIVNTFLKDNGKMTLDKKAILIEKIGTDGKYEIWTCKIGKKEVERFILPPILEETK